MWIVHEPQGAGKREGTPALMRRTLHSRLSAVQSEESR
jgi:hypothetical protein